MEPQPLVKAPASWDVSLELRPRVWALLESAARASGRDVDEIVADAVQEFLHNHPISFR